MRHADLPALANRFLLAGAFVLAGAGVDAGPIVANPDSGSAGETRVIFPRAESPSRVEVPSLRESPAAAGPTGLGFETGVAQALEESMPSPAPSLPGHLRASDREQDGRPPATPPAKRRSVPEPASILLVVTGLIGLAARRHLLRNRT